MVWGTTVSKVGNNSSREDLNLPSTSTRLQDSTRRFGFAQKANKQQSLRAAAESTLILRPALAIAELSARLCQDLYKLAVRLGTSLLSWRSRR